MHDIKPKVPFKSIIAVEPGISVKDLPATAEECTSRIEEDIEGSS